MTGFGVGAVTGVGTARWVQPKPLGQQTNSGEEPLSPCGRF